MGQRIYEGGERCFEHCFWVFDLKNKKQVKFFLLVCAYGWSVSANRGREI